MRMGSGDWFKTIVKKKKTNQDKSKKSKVPIKELSKAPKSSKKNGVPHLLSEDIAAIRIQTAFRAYKARKTLRCLRGMVRLRALIKNQSVRKQASKTLSYLHIWSRIQSQVSARRICMVIEGRMKQRKLESQLKVEAKLHDLQVEWCGGSETMEEIIARIQQREEAALKRERAMAYAFSHQWRANSGQNHGQFIYDVGKGDWGWSWMDRWIAARPWERRIPAQTISPCKMPTRMASKIDKKAQKISSSVKPSVPG